MRRLTTSIILAMLLAAHPAAAADCGRAVQVKAGAVVPCSGTLISDARARQAAAVKVALGRSELALAQSALDLGLARRLAELDRAMMAGMRAELAQFHNPPLWRQPAVAFGAGGLIVALIVVLVR
jgi:hypothetical protein